MSAHHGSENWDVKMQHLPNLETHQRLYNLAKYVGVKWVVMTTDCKWAIRNLGGVVRYRTTMLLSGEASCYILAVVIPCTL
jgi:hypothetical protein